MPIKKLQWLIECCITFKYHFRGLLLEQAISPVAQIYSRLHYLGIKLPLNCFFISIKKVIDGYGVETLSHTACSLHPFNVFVINVQCTKYMWLCLKLNYRQNINFVLTYSWAWRVRTELPLCQRLDTSVLHSSSTISKRQTALSRINVPSAVVLSVLSK